MPARDRVMRIVIMVKIRFTEAAAVYVRKINRFCLSGATDKFRLRLPEMHAKAVPPVFFNADF